MKDVYDIVKDILTSGLATAIPSCLAVVGVVYCAWSRERNKQLDRLNALEIERVRAQAERRHAKINAAWKRELENARKRKDKTEYG